MNDLSCGVVRTHEATNVRMPEYGARKGLKHGIKLASVAARFESDRLRDNEVEHGL